MTEREWRAEFVKKSYKQDDRFRIESKRVGKISQYVRGNN